MNTIISHCVNNFLRDPFDPFDPFGHNVLNDSGYEKSYYLCKRVKGSKGSTDFFVYTMREFGDFSFFEPSVVPPHRGAARDTYTASLFDECAMLELII